MPLDGDFLMDDATRSNILKIRIEYYGYLAQLQGMRPRVSNMASVYWGSKLSKARYLSDRPLLTEHYDGRAETVLSYLRTVNKDETSFDIRFRNSNAPRKTLLGSIDEIYYI